MKTSLVFATLILVSGTLKAEAWLKIGYYAKSCPHVEHVVRDGVQKAYAKDPRAPASLLRLHFHDCFVRGCDASLLLDVANGEKTAGPSGSLCGFEYVDEIKSKVEQICPETVSCADLLALIARDSVVVSGGIFWDVALGRRDGKVSIASEANKKIPSASSNVTELISSFQVIGLKEEDMITLSGAHTIGYASCRAFISRLYNFSGSGKPDPSIKPSFLKTLQKQCPQNGDLNTTLPLDIVSTYKFDNQYWHNLVSGMGLLFSDQVIFTTFKTPRWFVKAYSNSQDKFLWNFAGAMIKMGNISPLLAPNGEIRKNCRRTN